MSPKYVYEDTVWSGTSSNSNSKGGVLTKLRLLPNNITLFLSVLAFIPLAEHHLTFELDLRRLTGHRSRLTHWGRKGLLNWCLGTCKGYVMNIYKVCINKMCNPRSIQFLGPILHHDLTIQTQLICRYY